MLARVLQTSEPVVPRPARIETVLIVEDDDSIRRIAEVALSKVGGWRTLAAEDGVHALAVARAEQPDVILLDVMLPRLDGPATLSRLRQDDACAHIPVIFMTARIQAHEREQYARLGALGTIAKPFDPMALPEQILALWGGESPREPSAKSTLPAGFDDVLPRRIDALRIAVDTALRSSDADQWHHAERLAHQLAGSAGTFGSPHIGTVAGQIERALAEHDDASARAALAQLAAEADSKTPG
ncbi:MAG: response regulator [Myxococcota bacterium]